MGFLQDFFRGIFPAFHQGFLQGFFWIFSRDFFRDSFKNSSHDVLGGFSQCYCIDLSWDSFRAALPNLRFRSCRLTKRNSRSEPLTRCGAAKPSLGSAALGISSRDSFQYSFRYSFRDSFEDFLEDCPWILLVSTLEISLTIPSFILPGFSFFRDFSRDSSRESFRDSFIYFARNPSGIPSRIAS